MASTAALAGFGFLFWIISTRLFSENEIGLATSMISVMNLVALASLLGFSPAFVRFLPHTERKREYIHTGLMVVAVAAFALSSSFLAIVPFVAPRLAFLQHSPVAATLFVIACVMSALNVLTDAIFLSYRRTVFTFVITVIFSMAKLVAPFFLAAYGAIGIFGAAALSHTVGLVLSISALAYWFDYRPSLMINRRFLAMTWRYNAANHLSAILNLLPPTVIPLIILNRLGAEPAAHYYMAMMIGNLLYAIPFATAQSLFAEGSHDEDNIATQARKAAHGIALLLTPAIIVLVAGAGLLLSIFGSAYAAGGAGILRLIALSGVTVSAYSIAGAILLVRKDAIGIMILHAVYAATTIALTYALLPLGLTGIGIAWMIGNGVAGTVGYMLYRTNAPAHERIRNAVLTLAEGIRLKRAFYRAQRANGRRIVLLSYPEMPRTWHALHAIHHLLGFTITNDPRAHHDIAIAFADTTVRNDDPLLAALPQAVNARCGDIRKERVEEVFKEVFGYGSHVDPRTHDGPYVRKSDTNAVHDGIICTEPQEPQPGYIYQRLIDARCGEDKVRDIRVFVFGSRIPFVLYRYKGTDDRFDRGLYTERVDIDEALSTDEQTAILRFAAAFGIDYGELDVLRDNVDGRIYIVDANNTPGVPQPGVLPETERRWLSETLAQYFAEAFVPSLHH